VGAALFGVIGFYGFANLPGTLLGCALLVSGSVFIGASAVRKAQLITINVKHNGMDQSYDLKPLGDGSLAGPGGIDGREIIRFLSLDEATNYYTEILRSKWDAMNPGSTEGAKREEKQGRLAEKR
jgi:hypothetical protein